MISTETRSLRLRKLWEIVPSVGVAPLCGATYVVRVQALSLRSRHHVDSPHCDKRWASAIRRPHRSTSDYRSLMTASNVATSHSRSATTAPTRVGKSREDVPLRAPDTLGQIQLDRGQAMDAPLFSSRRIHWEGTQ